MARPDGLRVDTGNGITSLPPIAALFLVNFDARKGCVWPRTLPLWMPVDWDQVYDLMAAV